MGQRSDLLALSSFQRRNLVRIMLSYLDDSIIGMHAKLPHHSSEFFAAHRAYIAGMERFLANNGGKQFVPLPKWNPADPIPQEFDVVKERDNGRPRPPLEDLNPKLPIPANLLYPKVCDYANLSKLLNDLFPWHNLVHATIGGTMDSMQEAPAAPIFWCFHAYIDDIYGDWQRCNV